MQTLTSRLQRKTQINLFYNLILRNTNGLFESDPCSKRVVIRYGLDEEVDFTKQDKVQNPIETWLIDLDDLINI